MASTVSAPRTRRRSRAGAATVRRAWVARVRPDPAPRSGPVIFVLYVGLAIVYERRSALSHFGGGTIGAGPDVQTYLWGLHWWPYALGHGINPFVSHAV